MKAIAAMSENGVIGANGGIPWHLPDDFKHFKRMTEGGIIVMGRKTVESLPEPNDLGERLNGRPILKLTGGKSIDDILNDIILIQKNQGEPKKTIWVCGGAQIYYLLLPYCTELYLTRVFQKVPNGDAFMPPFHEHFIWEKTLTHNAKFCIELWRNKQILK